MSRAASHSEAACLCSGCGDTPYNLSAWKAETGELEVQGHPPLLSQSGIHRTPTQSKNNKNDFSLNTDCVILG